MIACRSRSEVRDVDALSLAEGDQPGEGLRRLILVAAGRREVEARP